MAMTVGRRLAVVILNGLLLCAGEASAAPQRYALIIGNNRGLADDVRLRFAQADAQRMARLLVSLGGFPEENTTVLKDRRAAVVRRALLSVNERIRRDVDGSSRQVVLFVYYSGHADAQALHLSGTTLEVDELRKMVVGSAAGVRALVLDACQSGSATRVKGGRPSPAFSINIVHRLASEGYAIVTSSAATEDSQESDRLKGSFFTHYLLSGMRGAGDRNGDRRVTLAEAYAYAYDNTLRATSRTMAGPQHPTYEYGIRGKGDLVLTELDRSRRHGALRFDHPGHYLVFKDDRAGAVVAEVRNEDKGARVVLPAGRYFVRKRGPDLLLEGSAVVKARSEVSLNEQKMRSVAYAQLVRKGKGARRLSHGPQLSYLLRGAVVDGLGPLSQVEVAWPLSLRHIRLTPRVAYGWLSTETPELELRHHELTLAAAAHYVSDISLFSFFAGLSAGWAWAHQSFDSTGLAPDRNGHLFYFAGEGGAEIHFGAGVFFGVRGAAATYVTRTGLRASPSTSPVLTYQFGAGLGWQVY